MNNVIQYLIDHGGCSIQYRIRREIFKEIASSKDLLNLKEQIMEKPKVKKIIDQRQSDGWLGNELHGGPGKGLDSSVTFLLNFGVERDSLFMKDVIKALLQEKKETSYRTTFKGGEALDLRGRGGNKAVKAGILAELGEENNLLVQDEIKTSLYYFRESLLYNNINDFSMVNKKGIRYYKPDAHFPGSNHLFLLAQTQSWRTTDNIELIRNSLKHCIKIMRGNSHDIMFKTSSYFVGPFNFNWNFYNFDIDELHQDSYALVWWLRNLFKLSKIGMINQLPELKKAYDYLYQLIKSRDILDKQNEESLKRYKQILSVENNWRRKESIICDVLFYSIINLHNAGYEVKEISF